MNFRKVIATSMNHSELAGYNWLTMSIALPTFIGIVYGGYLAYISENGLLVIIIGAVFIVLVAILLMWLVSKATLLATRLRLRKKQEDILSHVFGSYIFTPDVSLNGVTFTSTNLHMIDVIIAYASNNNIYFSPTLIYTKRPLIEVPLSNVRDVNIKNTTIKRQTEKESNDLNEAASISASTTGVFLPVGEIQKSLDKSLPMNRLNFEITTDSSSYQFLIHEKMMGKQVVQKLIEMVRGGHITTQ